MALTRQKYQMPADIREELENSDLMDAYLERPAYQQNDYIGWITRAKREVTRFARLRQMLDELESGDAYMRMRYSAARRRGE